jgi:hypothetical protein
LLAMSAQREFDVVIVTEPEGGYSVFVPELPSVATQGFEDAPARGAKATAAVRPDLVGQALGIGGLGRRHTGEFAPFVGIARDRDAVGVLLGPFAIDRIGCVSSGPSASLRRPSD